MSGKENPEMVPTNGQFTASVKRWRWENGERIPIGDEEVLDGEIKVLAPPGAGTLGVSGGLTLQMPKDFEFARKDVNLNLPVGAEMDPDIGAKLEATYTFVDDWVTARLRKFLNRTRGLAGSDDTPS